MNLDEKYPNKVQLILSWVMHLNSICFSQINQPISNPYNGMKKSVRFSSEAT